MKLSSQRNSMNFQSASDIEKHAADEIAKFLREERSLYIRISFFSDTKEIENIKKSISSVGIGILNWRYIRCQMGYGWCVLPSVSSGEFSKSERGGSDVFC